jgi:hypothetical protein
VAANADEGLGSERPGEAPRFEESELTDQYTDLTQLVTNRIAATGAELLDLVREQPLIPGVALAAGLGALLGLWAARRPRSRAERLQDAVVDQAETIVTKGRDTGRRVKSFADYGELVRLAMRLLENPLIRAYLLQQLTKRVAKQLK